MTQTFYSNGKLLLTGEYLVLDGAKALALPTKFGQDLKVSPATGKAISWRSYDSDGSIWFEDVIPFEQFSSSIDYQPSIKTTLIRILKEASVLNPAFLSQSGFHVETRLTFPKFWGLGTSSTLINNIAQWFGIDPYELLRNSFGGSGYDIACARSNSPLIYKLDGRIPIVNEVDFSPAFSDKIYFVYLNRKQSSKAAIASYYNNSQNRLDRNISEIDKLTEIVAGAENAGVFARALQKHEAIISDIIEMQTAGEMFFPDFPGVIKSLGGWGGDFVLAMSEQDPSGYFQHRGFNTVIPYKEMIK